MEPIDILYEDNHIIAINKCSSDLVQGDITEDITLADKVKAYIKKKYNKPGEVFLGIVHRLDRPVSGVVIFARTSKALVRLNSMFQEKQIKKTYWAIVKERPSEEEGRLVHYLLKDEEKNKSHAFSKPKGKAKESILTYKLIAASSNYNLLQITLETGRHHQIRCQLARVGMPIKGDLKYGFARSNKDKGICLHSRSIEFLHPVTKLPICILAPTPSMDNLWNELSASVR